jgi:glycogen(starch) synthase
MTVDDKSPRVVVATEVDLSQPYGHVVHLREMLSCLAKLGTRLTVIVPQTAGTSPSQHFSDEGLDLVAIPLHPVPKIRMILYELRVAWEIIRRNKKDPWGLIYTRSDLYSFGGWLASVILGKPHILELNGLKGDEVLHSGHPPTLARVVETLEGWLARRAKRVVVVTKGLLRRVDEVHHVPEERCVVVENGVNTQHFEPPLEEPPAEPFRIVFAGQLTRNQGIPTLLRAALLLRERCPEQRFQITVVGDGPERDAIMREHDELCVGDVVTFHGSVDYRDLPGVLGRHHIGVAPYTAGRNAEIGYSSIKVFSYLSCGLPVVASRLPGLGFLDECEVGVTVPPDDPEALASALMSVMRDRAGRREMSLRARELALSRLDWKRRAGELNEVIASVLEP